MLQAHTLELAIPLRVIRSWKCIFFVLCSITFLRAGYVEANKEGTLVSVHWTKPGQFEIQTNTPLSEKVVLAYTPESTSPETVSLSYSREQENIHLTLTTWVQSGEIHIFFDQIADIGIGYIEHQPEAVVMIHSSGDGRSNSGYQSFFQLKGREIAFKPGSQELLQELAGSEYFESRHRNVFELYLKNQQTTPLSRALVIHPPVADVIDRSHTDIISSQSFHRSVNQLDLIPEEAASLDMNESDSIYDIVDSYVQRAPERTSERATSDNTDSTKDFAMASLRTAGFNFTSWSEIPPLSAVVSPQEFLVNVTFNDQSTQRWLIRISNPESPELVESLMSAGEITARDTSLPTHPVHYQWSSDSLYISAQKPVGEDVDSIETALEQMRPQMQLKDQLVIFCTALKSLKDMYYGEVAPLWMSPGSLYLEYSDQQKTSFKQVLIPSLTVLLSDTVTQQNFKQMIELYFYIRTGKLLPSVINEHPDVGELLTLEHFFKNPLDVWNHWMMLTNTECDNAENNIIISFSQYTRSQIFPVFLAETVRKSINFLEKIEQDKLTLSQEAAVISSPDEISEPDQQGTINLPGEITSAQDASALTGAFDGTRNDSGSLQRRGEGDNEGSLDQLYFTDDESDESDGESYTAFKPYICNLCYMGPVAHASQGSSTSEGNNRLAQKMVVGGDVRRGLRQQQSRVQKPGMICQQCKSPGNTNFMCKSCVETQINLARVRGLGLKQ